MIYLFCNGGYGRPFLECAASYCRAHGLPLTVVYSARAGGPTATGVARVRRRLGAWLYRRRLPRPSGVEVIHATDVNGPEFLGRIGAPADGIIAGFNQIFGEGLIERFRTLVNFHPSILPHYRGPVPSLWCIRNGELDSGFTLHQVTRAIDRGPVLHQERVAIDGLSNPDALDGRIACAAAPTLVRYLEHLRVGGEWPKAELPPGSVYRNPVDYARFPDV